MIISHKYRYVFIMNPRTASTSIGRELCDCYGGEKILWKHALYSDFLKQASNDEKRYFAFTGQRNPLDELITLFFRQKYRNLEKLKKKLKLVNRKDIVRNRIEKSYYINKNDLTFVQYFNRYCRYNIDRSYLRIEREKMDFVYRYENLQDDFSSILKAIGIEQKRDLPQHSKKTMKKESDFYHYYTPDIRQRVQIVFSESFKEMGYAFPADWPKPTTLDYLLFYKDFMLKHPRGAMRFMLSKAMKRNLK